MTSVRAEFREKVIIALGPYGCSEDHPTMDVYHPGGHANPNLAIIMSAWDISVRQVVGENDDDRPEITVWQIHSKEATRARNNLRHEQLREAGLEGE